MGTSRSRRAARNPTSPQSRRRILSAGGESRTPKAGPPGMSRLARCSDPRGRSATQSPKKSGGLPDSLGSWRAEKHASCADEGHERARDDKLRGGGSCDLDGLGTDRHTEVRCVRLGCSDRLAGAIGRRGKRAARIEGERNLRPVRQAKEQRFVPAQTSRTGAERSRLQSGAPLHSCKLCTRPDRSATISRPRIGARRDSSSPASAVTSPARRAQNLVAVDAAQRAQPSLVGWRRVLEDADDVLDAIAVDVVQHQTGKERHRVGLGGSGVFLWRAVPRRRRRRVVDRRGDVRDELRRNANPLRQRADDRHDGRQRHDDRGDPLELRESGEVYRGDPEGIGRSRAAISVDDGSRPAIGAARALIVGRDREGCAAASARWQGDARRHSPGIVASGPTGRPASSRRSC